MKNRIIAVLLTISVCIPFSLNINASDELALSAKSALLMEADSKTVVFEKNSTQRMPMASTTKIMTALVVLENCELDHEFTVNEKAIGTEGTSAYLQVGDKLTVESALFALLLQSANDAANALAYEVSGSIEKFAELMNKKANELHLNNTSFKNPSGLPAEDHYTSAADLAYLGAVCIENKDFKRIVSSKSATVKINNTDRTFTNHNKLLSIYDGAFGIKTGFTKESGRCLIGAAERDGVRFVTVTLSASTDWKDHTIMFQYGFEMYRSFKLYKEGEFIIDLPVAGKQAVVSLSPTGTKSISLPKSSTISVKIEAPSLILSPINIGDNIATAIFFVNGKELCRTQLKAITKIR